MRTLVSNLTAAMLLVHALVGCCRHHDHHGASHDQLEATESLATECCHHEHGCCGDESEQIPPPCDCKLACKALCIFLPPEKYVVDAGDQVQSIDFPPINFAEAAIEVAGNSFWDRTAAYTALAPPLRLHLLHQIILI